LAGSPVRPVRTAIVSGVTWLIVAVVVAVLVVTWLTWTATRLERLDARCDAAWASLDAQLVRRAAAARRIAEDCHDELGTGAAQSLQTLADEAIDASRERRTVAENALSAQLSTIDPSAAEGFARGRAAVQELRDASGRVQMARTFYNDAVRDNQSLRAQWLPRVARLGRRQPTPEFFDIDDSSMLGTRAAGVD